MRVVTAGAPISEPSGLREPSLAEALARIAACAGEQDASPRFPTASFDALRAAGTPQLAADRDRCDLAREIALVRAVAGADGSTARILDGHFNGVERVFLTAPGELCQHDLAAVARGELLLGVWGADPGAGEGEPAWIEPRASGAVLRGTKVFCSGAGGVQRALVVARQADGGRRVAYIDGEEGVRIDRDWYHGSGLRCSESHRVELDGAPVLTLLGGVDELTREPYFSRDAVRTAATWAGLCDAIVSATVEWLEGATVDPLRLEALGRMRVAQATIDRWLEHAAQALGNLQTGPVAAEQLATGCRVAIAECARTISAQAARTCGSRALVGGGALDRARRDLDLFLLQHRLEPKLAALGASVLDGSGQGARS